ncbi:methyltransferase family protein [Solirubrobacter pauli]|uniref:Methyltransferase family protein n=1 Tax=Solirubrobacter pauli TaxID=166793 RepID=A0A660LIV0_9ACTN|nr:class I SAM-dependent methyltransferase [Solirubrobacter pauli]RKQ92881.1 methyltransferase family protein [Solirubrobacter pauli]
MKGLRPLAVEKLRRFTYIVPAPIVRRVKGRAEVFFWKAALESMVAWYDGREDLYGFSPPTVEQKVTGHTPSINAAMTWARVAQYPRYLDALDLAPDGLAGARVLDVGCGPMPNLLVFEDCERHGLDPLVDRYRAAGYPLDEWTAEGITYHDAPAETMPFPDGHFDVVVSVNAIDHVDDFGAVAREMRRVLKPGGRLRLQVNYHPATVTEPVAINDATMHEHFGWAANLRKLRDEPHPTEAGEALTFWVAGD